MNAFIAVTDSEWISRLASAGAVEANFWQPRPTRVNQPKWTPWIFKVRKSDRIAGFGFFSYWTTMPLFIAWETFREANGASSYTEMAERVQRLRGPGNTDDTVGCVILSNITLLARADWLAAPRDWHPNIVRGSGYDLDSGEGLRIWTELQALAANLLPPSPILAVPGGSTPQQINARRGQGAFRLMVMDAYDRRCAITGERTLPVLEAAHIKPFKEHELHEVTNGILMRSGIHRLYDRGLVTVDPNLTFRVSRSIERDYSNGKIYYALDGKAIASPASDDRRPNREALAWHASEVFRP